MKYTIVISQQACLLAGLLGKVNYIDLVILEYLRDFVFYAGHKSIYRQGKEYIWLNYTHLLKSLPFLGFQSKAALGRHLDKLRQAGLIMTYRAPENSLYYAFTEKMADLLFLTNQRAKTNLAEFCKTPMLKKAVFAETKLTLAEKKAIALAKLKAWQPTKNNN